MWYLAITRRGPGLLLGVTSISSRRQGCLLSPVASVRLSFGALIFHLQSWDDDASAEAAMKAGSWAFPGVRASPAHGGPYVCSSTALGGARRWRRPSGWGEMGILNVWGPHPIPPSVTWYCRGHFAQTWRGWGESPLLNSHFSLLWISVHR